MAWSRRSQAHSCRRTPTSDESRLPGRFAEGPIRHTLHRGHAPRWRPFEVWMDGNVAYCFGQRPRYFPVRPAVRHRDLRDPHWPGSWRWLCAPAAWEDAAGVQAPIPSGCLRPVAAGRCDQDGARQGRAPARRLQRSQLPLLPAVGAELASLDNVTVYTFLVPFQGEAKPIAVWYAADRKAGLAAPDARRRRTPLPTPAPPATTPSPQPGWPANSACRHAHLVWADGTRTEGFVGRALLEERLAQAGNRGAAAMKALVLRIATACLLLPWVPA